MNTTYSFADLPTVFSHPDVGQLSLQGEGLGSITYAMANDMTQHDQAADGSVMTSKIKTKNGTVTIQVQQTSDAAAWFRKYINYVDSAPTDRYTQASCISSSKLMRVTHTATGLAPQKRPDASYQQAGQQVAFTFMAEKIVEV